MPEPQFRRMDKKEREVVLERSRIIAVYVEVDNAYGVMVNGDEFMTREEKQAFLLAVRNLPTRD